MLAQPSVRILNTYMAGTIPEGIDANRFPFNPLFADSSPDDVVQHTWIVESLESSLDTKLLNELGITGEVRDKLTARMVLGRLSFKSMISRGVGFEDPDHSKFARMVTLAHRVVEESLEQDEAPDSTPPA